MQPSSHVSYSRFDHIGNAIANGVKKGIQWGFFASLGPTTALTTMAAVFFAAHCQNDEAYEQENDETKWWFRFSITGLPVFLLGCGSVMGAGIGGTIGAIKGVAESIFKKP